MKALVYHTFSGPLHIESVRDPEPPPDGVVIRIEATGLCRSDWRGWQGLDSDIRNFPHVPGHEFSGVIESVGSNITSWKPGHRVTAPFVCGCGRCLECRSGHPQVCDHQFQPGFTHWGSFAEYLALDYAEANLVRLPDELDFVTAAALGCRFGTAYRGIVELAGLRAGEWLAVFGCGGVGLSAILIARALEARVIAVDTHANALQRARELGAEVTLDPNKIAHLPHAIQEITNRGAHVSLDALGHRQTCLGALNSLRKRGRHIQIGLFEGPESLPALPADLIVGKELQLYGSHGIAAASYTPLLALIRDRKLDPGKLVGRKLALLDAPLALRNMDRFEGTGITVIDRLNL